MQFVETIDIPCFIMKIGYIEIKTMNGKFWMENYNKSFSFFILLKNLHYFSTSQIARNKQKNDMIRFHF